MKHLRPEHVRKELVKILKTNLRKIHGNGWSPLNPPLFSCLRRLGRSAGYTVWARRHGGEFLWDIVWSYEPETARRYWLELVGEIELSDQDPDSLITDFYKVLDAKARLKVFLCASPTSKGVGGICDEIDWAVSHQLFRLPEERLIAVVLDYNGRTGTYPCRIRLFNGSGPIGKWHNKWEEVTFKA